MWISKKKYKELLDRIRSFEFMVHNQCVADRENLAITTDKQTSQIVQAISDDIKTEINLLLIKLSLENL